MSTTVALSYQLGSFLLPAPLPNGCSLPPPLFRGHFVIITNSDIQCICYALLRKFPFSYRILLRFCCVYYFSFVFTRILSFNRVQPYIPNHFCPFRNFSISPANSKCPCRENNDR